VAKLPTIDCPRCGKKVESKDFNPVSKGGAHHANSYESCLRKCKECGFGFSNANTDQVADLTIIYRNPFWNVPVFIAEGYEFTLKNSMNVVNQPSKLEKFASSKSEDHVTWTVFRYIQTQNEIRDVSTKVGIEFARLAIDEPTLLLWGVPIPKDDSHGKSIRHQLENIVDAIGEDSKRRSEPDVILDFGDAGLVFVEVKLWSPNEAKKGDYAGWGKYLASTEAFLDPSKVKRSGFYELSRNWRIAWEMANSRPVALVNLGPDTLFKDDDKANMENFCESLRLSPIRQFLKVTWKTFLDAIPNKPEWFSQYIQNRRLVNS
jgi:hypothetical protein